MLPGEEMLPPCCEECEDEGNNPDCMLTCEKYKKIMDESNAADRQMYDDYVETEKLAQDLFRDYTRWIEMTVNKTLDTIHRDLARMYEQTSTHEEAKLDPFNRLLDRIEQLIEDEKHTRRTE